MENVQPCPKCSNTEATKVRFTWWGGALGPGLLSVVKCEKCSQQYNGKTGKLNTNAIIIYSVVLGAIVIAVSIALT